MSVKGIVEKIGQRGKAWNVVINGKQYGFGFKAPAFTVGNMVSFETKDVVVGDRTYVNVVEDTVVVTEVEATPPPKAAAPVKSYAKATAPEKKSDGYWDAKDRKITYLACQKDAIQIVDMALRNDALSLGAAKNKKLGVILATVNLITGELFQNVVSGEYENMAQDAPGSDVVLNTETQGDD